ncbi:MAG: hypothetical protein RBT80_00770 [Candidatus Vecturithrix sp.]|nr:hypothetical protein [Candidatus Vecturithrix sp.]
MNIRNNKIDDLTILQQQRSMHKHGSQTPHVFLFSLVLTCLCVFCVLPSVVYAATSISGLTITQDLTLGPNIDPANPYGIAPDTTYIITGDVTVRHSSANSSTATLTIEPGVELQFETGTGCT